MQSFQKRFGVGLIVAVIIIVLAEGVALLYNSYTNIENDGFDPRATPLSLLAGYERGATCTKTSYDHWRCTDVTITALRMNTLDGHDTIYYTESYDGDHVPSFSFLWFVVEVGNFSFCMVAFMLFVVAMVVIPDDESDEDKVDPHPPAPNQATVH